MGCTYLKVIGHFKMYSRPVIVVMDRIDLIVVAIVTAFAVASKRIVCQETSID